MASAISALVARGPLATRLFLLAAFAAAYAIASTPLVTPPLPPAPVSDVCAPNAMGDIPCGP